MKHPKNAAVLFKNLYLSGAPGSTYPFLMQLSKALQDGQVSEKDVCESLQVIESFLVRRATCGHEPTGLHAVFKRLWADCEGVRSKEIVEKEIRKHKTVVWPNDDTFKEAIRNRPLYGVGITKYLLREYNCSLGGDQPENVPWLEHVLPDNPAKEWLKDFTKEQHQEMKDLLANLIPLSKEMNIGLSNKPYSNKRKTYESDSMFKSTRQFAQTQTVWTPVTLQARAKILADWAAKRWQY